MPGSLFPRSPSLVPESLNERHVRFKPNVASPTPARPVDEPGPSQSRPPMAPAVKAAVDRFRVERDHADPSILLPKTSPQRSTGQSFTRPLVYRNASVDGGSFRVSDDSDDDDDEYPPRISASAKGKGRAVDDFMDGDTSGHIRVRGKERELVAAREEQRRNEKRRATEADARDVEKEKNSDKERIRMLEEEIMRLKDEVPTSISFMLDVNKVIVSSSLEDPQILHRPSPSLRHHPHLRRRRHLRALSTHEHQQQLVHHFLLQQEHH